jgi:predicted nucleic acid-binding protein
VVTPIFFDTSLLLAGLIELRPPNPAAHAVMDAVADGRLGRCQTAWHCCLELYSVATRLPAEYRLRAADALRLIEEEVFARFDIVQLPDADLLTLLRTAVREDVIGGRIYDSHIAETARAAGAALVLTENRRHFISLLRHGIQVQTAAEFIVMLDADRSATR